MALVPHAGTNSFLSPVPHMIRTILEVVRDPRLVARIHHDPLLPRSQSLPKGTVVLEAVFLTRLGISFIPWPAATKAPVLCLLVPALGLIPCLEGGNLVPAPVQNKVAPKQHNQRTDVVQPAPTPNVDEGVMIARDGCAGIEPTREGTRIPGT
jgi:hypothetical protein